MFIVKAIFWATSLACITSVDNDGDCPSGCLCNNPEALLCSGIYVFPSFSNISRTVTFIRIRDSTLPEITHDALMRFPNVVQVNFNNVSIGTVRECAFNSENLPSLNMILMKNVKVKTFKSGAFVNMISSEKGLEIRLDQAQIQLIESYAFANITSPRPLTISGSNITTIEPVAFYNIMISSFRIHNSYIDTVRASAFTNTENFDFFSNYIVNLECGAFDGVFDGVGRGFNFYELDVICDCGLVWMLNISADSLSVRTQLSSVRCHLPAHLSRRNLLELNVTEICPDGRYEVNCPVELPKPLKTCRAQNAGSVNSETSFHVYVFLSATLMPVFMQYYKYY